MKKFLVTYYNAARKVENSVTVLARSLESATAEEEKAMAMMNQINPYLSIKSIVEVSK
jgi:hypothetical protein